MKDLKLFSKCLVVCERLNIEMENEENENFSNGKICSEQDFNFYRRKTIENTLNSYLDNKAKDKGNRRRKRLKCEADCDIKKFEDKCNSLKVKNLILLRPSKCQYIFCRERFRRKHFLKKYLMILPREKFKCKVCQINFSNNLIYRTHLSIHCGKKSFAYNICKGKINFNFDLKRHGKISTSNNNYHCKDCNKHFKFQYILKNHLKRHNIDKSFCCSSCTKSFKTKSELIQHQISHSGDRPHKCEVCGKIFKTKPHLMNHISTHSEDRPFSV
ncbi:zinc finger protein 60-like isoform X1 [Centruroides vittatus]|uniref:zinc finger protein 60-like isoform X1 n=1 Tax=Centruroides vittatus TaxID=120091 RepID=UPI00350F8F8D